MLVPNGFLLLVGHDVEVSLGLWFENRAELSLRNLAIERLSGIIDGRDLT